MSPLTVVVCAALVSVTCAGLLPSGGRSEYKLAVNYHSEQEASARQLVSSSSQLEQPQSDINENVEVIPEEAKAVEEVESDDTEESSTPLPEANPSENTPSELTPETTPAEPTAETVPSQQSPLAPSAVSRVSSSSSSGSGGLSYAYHGETQHASSSSSRISQTLTSNVHAYPAQTSELHFTPEVHHVTFYHPEQLQASAGQVVAVARADHPQYLQHDRPRVLTTHGILTPAGAAVTTYEAAPIAHFTPVQPQPIREQAFSVNVASAKYGYGYTVRGVQHAHPQ